MDFILDRLVECIQGKLTRRVFLFCALLFSIIGYTYVVEFYDPNNNLLRQVWRGVVQENYTFYSGSPGGFYIKIGKLLDKETERDAGIRVVVKETSGGFENATSVMKTTSSFGLVQEDTISENNFIREHIRYITPLYLEQMHIIYRHDEFLNLTKEVRKKNSKLPILSPDNEVVKKFFRKARISTGPQGSGSRIFARYLLRQSEIDKVQDLTLKFDKALDKLKKGEVDIVFCIAGAPLPDVTDILKENKNVRLMSIDPVLLQKLNKSYGLRLHHTTFKKIYDEGESISTIGSYAFLIASKDVPNSSIMELISILENSKKRMKEYKEYGSFQLNQIDFYSIFKREQEGFLMIFLRSLFLFIVSVVITTTGAMVFLQWVVSGYKQATYFRYITDLYSKFLPENTIINEKDSPLPKPIIYENQNEIIARLVRGTAQSLVLAKRIREDYKTGAITITHHRHLQNNLYSIKDSLQSNLAQRLNEVLENRKDVDVSQDLLRHYYTAGYLKRENYRDLLVALKAKLGKTG